MRTRRGYLALLTVIALTAIMLVAGTTIAMAKPAPPKAQVYMAKLMPLNGSGVMGTAIFKIKKGVLTVKVNARGLEPNMVHMQHIHGFTSGQVSVCPTAGADVDMDGTISLVEGLPAYGPVLLPLTPYPTASMWGTFNYRAMFADYSMVTPLNIRTIVVHGMTVGGVYDPTVPVACAQIRMLTPMR